MIIGIDGRINLNRKTGIGYLVSNLVFSMVNLDKDNNYKILGGVLDFKEKNVKQIILPKILQKGLNFLWKKFFFPPLNILIGKTDVFIFTNFVDLPVKAKKRILMIHDVSFLKYPQFTERRNLSFLRKNVLPAIKRSDIIITISQDAKKEIISYYNADPNKIFVMYLAPNDGIKKIDDKEKIFAVLVKYNIKKKYILSVGTVEPRKNLKNLIMAYISMGDDIKEKYQLVIAGGKGWNCEDIFEFVSSNNLEENIIFTGYVNELDLSMLYSGASIYVQPSLYEGFGIPILEAFKCGIPVLSSRTSSLPEVAGEAAIYFNPLDINEIKKGIESILKNDSLVKELIQKGYKQLEEFSWEKSARSILKIINK